MGVFSNIYSYSLKVFIVFLKLGHFSQGSNCLFVCFVVVVVFLGGGNRFPV